MKRYGISLLPNNFFTGDGFYKKGRGGDGEGGGGIERGEGGRGGGGRGGRGGGGRGPLDHLLSKQLMRNWEHVQLFQICVLPHAQ